MYFQNFDLAEDTDSRQISPPRYPDPGKDRLPFDLLDDRQFEILVYRIKRQELSDRARVRLMQGVGERGRDVVVHTTQGRISEIVQCKCLSSRLSLPDLIRELLKLALHAFLEPSILEPGPVQYELWCPGDFSEPAANLFDRWPLSWRATDLAPEFEKIRKKYAAFENLTWEDAGDFVVKQFPAIVAPRGISNVDMTPRLRRHVSIYQDFFAGKVVANFDDLKSALRLTVEEMGFQRFSDEDARHVLERISLFPDGARLAFTSGYTMGLSAELVSKFNQGEFQQFVAHVEGVLANIGMLVLDVAFRLASESAATFRKEIAPAVGATVAVFHEVLRRSADARVMQILSKGLEFWPERKEYNSLPLEERLERHARQSWESCQKSLSEYDPVLHGRGSDEHLRALVAERRISEFSRREDFEEALLESTMSHLPEIRRRFDEFMSLIPIDLMVVADAVSIFQSQRLMTRLAKDIERMNALRGSDILPELVRLVVTQSRVRR